MGHDVWKQINRMICVYTKHFNILYIYTGILVVYCVHTHIYIYNLYLMIFKGTNKSVGIGWILQSSIQKQHVVHPGEWVAAEAVPTAGQIMS